MIRIALRLLFRRILLLKFSLRTYVYTKVSTLQLSHGPGLRVNARCHFGANTTVGSDCHFNGLTVQGCGRLIIGNHFHSGTNILILTSSHNYKSTTHLPYDNTELVRDVIIGDSVWLGSRVILLPGTILARGVVVQAGSVVRGPVPEGAIIGGNPANVFSYRDLDLLDKLSSDQSYI
jgi:chloramphenicol O-acetyltransferase type B